MKGKVKQVMSGFANAQHEVEGYATSKQFCLGLRILSRAYMTPILSLHV
jgi:hypothetical protein